ncbi:LysE family transporter [Winogradskyella flava]|uniref:LysE family transporter n=1 Tax=Winogradskyella flava TaxID=1884876 RepID=UPI002492DD47|nr:LysE family transporter [Winogradskyella flava]
MIIIYLFIGLITSIIGALPLGATNIAVINTTLKHNTRQAFKISFAAGFAEVILSYYALHCNMTVRIFFESNQWIQILIALLLLSAGGFLFFKSTKKKSDRKQLKTSKYMTGFLLGLLNPPVLLFWLVIYGVINNYAFSLSIESSFLVLFLFFFGVYLGKLITLHLYSKFSLIIRQKFENINTIINKVTGSLLFVIGLFNVIKIYVI